MPRSAFEATLVFVETDEGLTGIGSGDTMDGFEAFEHLFVGEDPLDLERHVRVLETIAFHAGRYWPLEAALWDIAGKAQGVPVAELFGGQTERLPVYASTGAAQSPDERAESALALRERASAPSSSASTATASTTGSRRSPPSARRSGIFNGDHGRPERGLAHAGRRAPPLDFETVRSDSRTSSASTTSSGSRSRSRVGRARARQTPRRDGRDARGRRDGADDGRVRCVPRRGRARRLSARRRARGRPPARQGGRRARALAGGSFTPHTWTNGLGLLVNLHVAAGVGAGPYLEYPYDPPTWTPERRDFLLAEPLALDDDGCLPVPDRPGLGVSRGCRGSTSISICGRSSSSPPSRDAMHLRGSEAHASSSSTASTTSTRSPHRLERRIALLDRDGIDVAVRLSSADAQG